MNILKILTIVIVSFALISCGEYKPLNPEQINIMAKVWVKVWNVLFIASYIFIFIGCALKRFKFTGFCFLFLLHLYIAFFLFDFIFPHFNLTLGLPF